MKRLLLACTLLGLSNLAVAADLPRADPASVGLDGHQLDAITAKLKQDVADHVLHALGHTQSDPRRTAVRRTENMWMLEVAL